MDEDNKKRRLLLVLLFLTVVINYMDRMNISVAAAAIREDLEISTETMGFVFSAFFIPYALLQIPGGFIADLVKTRILYPIILIGWSIATVLQGFVNSASALMGARAIIGGFEAPSYPINNKIVTDWFPKEERASAISIYTSGQFLGLAFLTPILFTIQSQFGWRGLMVITGLIGIIWAVVWYLVYPKNEPQAQTATNEDLIKPTTEKRPSPAIAFIHPKLWGLYIGQFCLGTTTIFFLTWFPSYLTDYRGLALIKSGLYASVPFIAAFFGVLLSGFASDYMVKKGISAEFSRKAPVLLGMALSTIIIAANFTDNTTLIIIFMAIAFFGNGLASIAWVFVSLLSPRQSVGLVGGVFNSFGALSAVVTPIVIGYIVTEDSFAPALFYIGAAALIGLLCYVFLIGKVEEIGTRKVSEETSIW